MKPFIHISTLALSLFAAGQLLAAEITVFAAASLTDSLKEIAVAYEKATGDKIRFNFAASNVLAQQIQAGAPADLFFSADEAQMDSLETAGLIVKDTRKDLLGNSLVIITLPGGPPISTPQDLVMPTIKYLSLANPKAVPAGIYAKAWLEKIGLWTALQLKVVPAENVRAALAVVESGNAEAGIVYKTDAAISKKVKVALEVPAADGPKITYPAALLKDSRHAEAARKFLTHLADKQAGETFAKFGFSVILKGKIETTKNTKDHENQRVRAKNGLIQRVDDLISLTCSHLVSFRVFRGSHFGFQDNPLTGQPHA